jgi:hypothetical protein
MEWGKIRANKNGQSGNSPKEDDLIAFFAINQK